MTHNKSHFLLTGFSLLGMSILAPIAYFVKFETIFNQNLISFEASPELWSSFIMGICFFLIVAVLDILVSWGLWRLLKETHPQLMIVSTSLRLIYTVFLVLVVGSLYFEVLSISQGTHNSMVEETQLYQSAYQNFERIWIISLGLFGVHLVTLGMVYTSVKTMKNILGPLIIVAGLGYVWDGIGFLINSQFSWVISQYTFMGEVLLMFYLIWRGFQGVKTNHSRGRAIKN